MQRVRPIPAEMARAQQPTLRPDVTRLHAAESALRMPTSLLRDVSEDFTTRRSVWEEAAYIIQRQQQQILADTDGHALVEGKLQGGTV